jgi:Tfp pilus assembly protein PilF
MLKDLDRGRGPVDKSQVSALQGMGLVDEDRFNWYDSLFVTAWAIAGLLAVIVSYQLSTRWSGGPETERAITAPKPVELVASEAQSQSDTGSLQLQLDVAPPVAVAEVHKQSQEAQHIPIVPPEKPPQVEPLSSSEKFITSVNILTPEQKAERLFAKAQQALSGRRWQNGELLLRRVLEENPRHIAARGQLATLLLSMQQEVKAENLLADGLRTEPQQLSLAKPYSQLLAARGELVAALQALDRAIGQRQADPETLALRAAILYRLARHSESAADYREAVRIQPDRALWWTGLAVALEQDGQSKQALEAFQRAAERPLNKPVDAYVQQRIKALSDEEFNY